MSYEINDVTPITDDSMAMEQRCDAFTELYEHAKFLQEHVKLLDQVLLCRQMVEEQLDPSLHPIRAAFNALKTLGLASLWILDSCLKFLFVTQFELKKKQA